MRETSWRRLIILPLMAAMIISGCGKKSVMTAEEIEATENEVLKVEVVKPTREEVSKENSYIGTVMAGQQVYVVPLVSGTVTEVNYSVGDTVQAGDVLFKIDDKPAQLQVKSANATYNQAAAGVKAATGGARDIQNLQTETNITTLKDNLGDTNSTLNGLYDQMKTINSAIDQVTTLRDQAEEAEAKAKEMLKKVADKIDYKGLSAEKQMLKDELATLKATGSAIDPNVGTPNNSYEETYTNLTNRIALIDQQIAPFLAVDSATAAKDALEAQVQTLVAQQAQLQSGIDQAEIGKRTLETNLDMAQSAQAITNSKVYPETDASYRAQLSAASLAIESANYQLTLYTVTTPISGVVDTCSVAVNQMTSAGSQAFVISDKSDMSVLFFVTEAVHSVLNVGDVIKAEDKDGELIEGVITEIGGMTNQQLRMFQIKAEFPGAEHRLENGTSAKVFIETEKEEGKLSVPYDALHFSAGEAYLFCLEDGEIVRHSVTVGLMNDTMAVIEDGIDENAQVVSSWSSKLRNHAKAEAINGGEE